MISGLTRDEANPSFKFLVSFIFCRASARSGRSTSFLRSSRSRSALGIVSRALGRRSLCQHVSPMRSRAAFDREGPARSALCAEGHLPSCLLQSSSRRERRRGTTMVGLLLTSAVRRARAVALRSGSQHGRNHHGPGKSMFFTAPRMPTRVVSLPLGSTC